MKIKDLETALKYFSPIFKEENLPSKLINWRNDMSDEELNSTSLIYEQDQLIYKNNIVVDNMYHSLYFYEDYLVYDIGISRRGQNYYILCDKQNLELSILATTPDGEGCDINLPNVLYDMIKNGDIII